MIVIYLRLLLIIYITNLNWWKICPFYSVQRRNSGTKNAHFFGWENIMSVGSNFLCGHSHGADPSPVRIRPLSLTPFSFHVCVINGWSLNICTLLGRS